MTFGPDGGPYDGQCHDTPSDNNTCGCCGQICPFSVSTVTIQSIPATNCCRASSAIPCGKQVKKEEYLRLADDF